MHQSNESLADLTLREHQLVHITELRADPRLFSHRFARACSTGACSAQCCRSGVIVDSAQRDFILANAEVVQRHLEPAQEHDPAQWFESVELDDPDLPSGRGSDTRVVNDGCVFLNSSRLCTLQIAEAEVAGLKPFFCRAYPLVVMSARVEFDDEHCPGESGCCAMTPDGELTVFEAFDFELRLLLGDRGAAELRRMTDVEHTRASDPQTSEP